MTPIKNAPLVNGSYYDATKAGIKPADREYKARVTGIRPTFVPDIYGFVNIVTIRGWYDGGSISTFTFAGGSNYTGSAYYTGIQLTGGSGAGATANISVSGGAVTAVALVLSGYGYLPGDVLSATITNGSGFALTVGTVGTNHALTVPLPSIPTGSYFIVSGTASASATIPLSFVGSVGRNAYTDTLVSNAGTTTATYSIATSFRLPAQYEVMWDVTSNQLYRYVATTSGTIGYAAGTTLTAGGSGYTNGTYTGVALSGGSGTGATANITVIGRAVTSFSLVSGGSGYVIGDYLDVAQITTNPIGAGTGFYATVTSINQTNSTLSYSNWAAYKGMPERAIDGMGAFALLDPDGVYSFYARLASSMYARNANDSYYLKNQASPYFVEAAEAANTTTAAINPPTSAQTTSVLGIGPISLLSTPFGLFAISGETNKGIYRSTDDGVTWSNVLTGVTMVTTGAYGNGMAVVPVSGGGIRYTTNGTTWTSQTSPSPYTSILFTKGVFIALPASGLIQYNANPANSSGWLAMGGTTTGTTLPAYLWKDTTYAVGNSSNTDVIAVGGTANGTLSISTNGGQTFSVVTLISGDTSGGALDVVAGNGMLLAYGIRGWLARSTDGVTWTRLQTSTTLAANTAVVKLVYVPYYPRTGAFVGILNLSNLGYVPITTIDGSAWNLGSPLPYANNVCGYPAVCPNNLLAGNIVVTIPARVSTTDTYVTTVKFKKSYDMSGLSRVGYEVGCAVNSSDPLDSTRVRIAEYVGRTKRTATGDGISLKLKDMGYVGYANEIWSYTFYPRIEFTATSVSPTMLPVTSSDYSIRADNFYPITNPTTGALGYGYKAGIEFAGTVTSIGTVNTLPNNLANFQIYDGNNQYEIVYLSEANKVSYLDTVSNIQSPHYALSTTSISNDSVAILHGLLPLSPIATTIVVYIQIYGGGLLKLVYGAGTSITLVNLSTVGQVGYGYTLALGTRTDNAGYVFARFSGTLYNGNAPVIYSGCQVNPSTVYCQGGSGMATAMLATRLYGLSGQSWANNVIPSVTTADYVGGTPTDTSLLQYNDMMRIYSYGAPIKGFFDPRGITDVSIVNASNVITTLPAGTYVTKDVDSNNAGRSGASVAFTVGSTGTVTSIDAVSWRQVGTAATVAAQFTFGTVANGTYTGVQFTGLAGIVTCSVTVVANAVTSITVTASDPGIAVGDVFSNPVGIPGTITDYTIVVKTIAAVTVTPYPVGTVAIMRVANDPTNNTYLKFTVSGMSSSQRVQKKAKAYAIGVYYNSTTDDGYAVQARTIGLLNTQWAAGLTTYGTGNYTGAAPVSLGLTAADALSSWQSGSPTTANINNRTLTIPAQASLTKAVSIVTMTNSGAGYGTPSGSYVLEGGTGYGLKATFTVVSGVVTVVTVDPLSRGTGYSVGDILRCPTLPSGVGFSCYVAALTTETTGRGANAGSAPVSNMPVAADGFELPYSNDTAAPTWAWPTSQLSVHINNSDGSPFNFTDPDGTGTYNLAVGTGPGTDMNAPWNRICGALYDDVLPAHMRVRYFCTDIKLGKDSNATNTTAYLNQKRVNSIPDGFVCSDAQNYHQATAAVDNVAYSYGHALNLW